MAHNRYLAEKEGIKLIPSPEKPRIGEKVFIRCIVLDQNGFPLEEGTVNGIARHADGNMENLSFLQDPECPGVYLSSVGNNGCRQSRDRGDMRVCETKYSDDTSGRRTKS